MSDGVNSGVPRKKTGRLSIQFEGGLGNTSTRANSEGTFVNNAMAYKGSCFCNVVQVTVSFESAAMGYCHCESCRSWSAGPVNAFTLWKPEAVQVPLGADNIGTYKKTPRCYRKWCNTCGSHVFTEHPIWGLIDVYAAVIPEFPYRAGVHVNYQETKLRIRDGLPRMKDVPKEMGGSGVSMAEQHGGLFKLHRDRVAS